MLRCDRSVARGHEVHDVAAGPVDRQFRRSVFGYGGEGDEREGEGAADVDPPETTGDEEARAVSSEATMVVSFVLGFGMERHVAAAAAKTAAEIGPDAGFQAKAFRTMLTRCAADPASYVHEGGKNAMFVWAGVHNRFTYDDEYPEPTIRYLASFVAAVEGALRPSGSCGALVVVEQMTAEGVDVLEVAVDYADSAPVRTTVRARTLDIGWP
jgi:hypothetical protein